MARNVANLDPDLLEKARTLVFNEELTAPQIAFKLGVDRRWVTELRRYFKMTEHGLQEPIHTKVSPDKRKQLEEEHLIAQYRALALAQIPVAERVRVLRALLQSKNDQAKLRALDKLDQLEGINKDKAPEKPVPLFLINADEEPDVRRVDFRVSDEVSLWLDDWKIHNPEDGTVGIVCWLGEIQSEEAQKYLRALTSGANVGIRGRMTKEAVHETSKREDPADQGSAESVRQPDVNDSSGREAGSPSGLDPQGEERAAEGDQASEGGHPGGRE